MAQVINGLIPAGGSYWEPFVGSGQMLQRVRAARRFGSDLDHNIIDLLKAVQRGWQPPRALTVEEHKHWRRRARAGVRHPMVAFAGYGCSFGGGFFAGYARDKRGEGDPAHYAGAARRSLLDQKPLLATAVLRAADYRAGFWMGFRPDVVYCDIPYAGTSVPGNRGGGRGKTTFDHDAFWKWAAEAGRESTVLVSEYECPAAGARVVWERTLWGGLRYQDGSARKTERLFVLCPKAAGRIGLGLF
jgi:DNA adenine methylase